MALVLQRGGPSDILCQWGVAVVLQDQYGGGGGG